MKATSLVRRILNHSFLVGGLLLVLAATAGVAQARTPARPFPLWLDPGSIASGLTLLTGGMLIFTARIRQK